MARVSAPPRIWRGVSSNRAGRLGSYTYVDNHIPNNFIVCNEIRIFLLCLEETVQEVIRALAQLRVLHALFETLHSETSGYGEVVEFVDGARPLGVFPKPTIEDWDLSDLIVSVLECYAQKSCTYHREVSHHAFGSTEHVTNVFGLFHEADALAPSTMAKEVPCEE
jgi:hypothetical protein